MNTLEYTVTTGISRKREYVFVTHNETGKQWMSKSEASDDSSLDRISTNIQLGITKFDPRAVIATCDARFWMPVKKLREFEIS